VHGAAKTALENRAVDLAEFRGGRGILDTDNNPVRVKKISDGGAFAKEFGIGGHSVFHTADFGIGGEGAAEFETGARRDGTLFDDELGRFCFGGDLPGHVVNGGGSASPESFGGVPTQMKMASPARIASAASAV